CCPAVAARRPLSPTGADTAAAEAENAGSPLGVAGGACRAGAPAVDCGRSALGGSLDAGVSQPARRAGANSADVDAVHVSPPVYPALAATGVHRPAHPHPPLPSAGGPHGHGSGRWEGI